MTTQEKAPISTIKIRNYLLVILAFAFLVRLATAIWLGDKMEVLPAGGTHDQVSYDMLAHRLATGHGFTFPTRWYPWIEPDTVTSYYSGTMVLHLAAIYYVFGYHPLIARIFYTLLGTWICYFVYRIGNRISGTRAGLLAATSAAGYAYLILYSAALLTETPFIFFLLLAIDTTFTLLLQDDVKHWVLLGIALAGTILFRMAVLPFVVLLLLWIFYNHQTHKLPLKIWQYLIPVGIIIIAVLPWAVRNYILFDRFMLLESQFGHVFWNSNHPERDLEFEVAWVAPIPTELANLNEVDLTNELARQGIQNVLSDPLRFLLLTLNRIKVFFMFWPSADSSPISNLARVLSFGVFLPFMLYGLLISLRQWKKCLILYLFLVIHLGVYLISWVMIRYRIPADTVLLVFAGLGLSDLYDRGQRWVTSQRARKRVSTFQRSNV